MRFPIYLLALTTWIAVFSLAAMESIYVDNRAHHVGNFQTTDGHSLRYAHLVPSSAIEKKPAAVVFVHGRATFLECYEELFTQFLRRGYEIYSYDLTGQGGSSRIIPSEKRKQHIESFSHYEKHLAEFIENVVTTEKPIILTGYSVGATIVSGYLIAELTPKTNVVASLLLSPLTYAHLPVPYFAFEGISRALKTLGQGENYVFGKNEHEPVLKDPTVAEKFTSDSEQAKKYISRRQSHPDFLMGGVTYTWFVAATDAARYIDDHAHYINKRTLFISPGDDRIVNTVGHEALAKKMNATYVTIANARHELFSETSEIRQELWKAIDDFLDDNKDI